MTARRKLAAVLASLAVLGGLVTVGGAAPAGAGHTPDDGYFDLGALPGPDRTGEQIFDGLKQFVDDFPYRVTGTPSEILAGEALRAELAGIGYDSKIEELPPSSGLPGAVLKAVVAVKKGTTRPDEWIMFVGHYDSIATTIYGAYDNGAGTNLIRNLAHEFADVETNRSLAFVFYNGEEEGLLASQRHAAALKAAGQNITAVLGFDMVGIAWPVKQPGSTNCLCMWHGPSDGTRFRPLLEHVNFEFLEFPKGTNLVNIVGINNRNSDERSFATQGYPTLRWAGMRRAADYPAYHLPHDTIETIVDVAGGEEYYEQGIFNTLKSSYYTALALDNHAPVPVAEVTSQSGSTVALSAAGSTDQDGSISTYSWDFGDGTTAQGETVEHTFDAPGTYTIKLTVADNLWPSVTRSTTLAVTI